MLVNFPSEPACPKLTDGYPGTGNLPQCKALCISSIYCFHVTISHCSLTPLQDNLSKLELLLLLEELCQKSFKSAQLFSLLSVNSFITCFKGCSDFWNRFCMIYYNMFKIGTISSEKTFPKSGIIRTTWHTLAPWAFYFLYSRGAGGVCRIPSDHQYCPIALTALRIRRRVSSTDLWGILQLKAFA